MADLVAEALARAGASTAFAGSAGHGAAGVATLVAAAPRWGLRVVDAPRGRAACVMASVTGLLTDAPGVAAVALDDAEPEIRAALEQAARDAAPLVLVTDRAFAAPVAAIAKASLAMSADAAAHWSAHACQLALTEPRGPVHLVVTAETAATRAVPLATAVRPAPLPAPDAGLLDEAADTLAGAQRPILVAGRQCRTLDIAAWLRALAESLPAPVLVTAGGKGAIPDPHPLNLGLVRSEPVGGGVLQRADLAIAIGVDAAELPHGGLPPALPVLHLAASPWARAEGRPRMEVVGEIALLIEELAPRLRGRARADWDVAELDRLKRAMGPGRTEGRLVSSAVANIVREATAPGTVAVVAADDDTESVLAAWQTVTPRALVVPDPPRLRGFAVPAVIGAAIARPGVRVVCFASARQLRDSQDALETAAHLTLPALVLIIGEHDGAAPESLADVVGDHAWVVRRARDAMSLRMAIEQALSSPRATLVDARAHRVDDVG